ncbi:hypothetical protein DYU11_13190 [Fibrisoma montanum]|uniref:Uncharacterized protein n=1 Tax=Fibrisoma montanum TaxID=2305895 RepID=A0A418MC15_9BACT|nr:hypothetical protein [Fibrisoma montanum]RIV23914.1 hypothetical protein DYU11_13190 [Fibrisoma montanum]
MHKEFRTVSDGARPIENQPLSLTSYPNEKAEAANRAFDDAVRQFLRDWIEHGTVSEKPHESGSDVDEFIEQGALRTFFIHTPDPFEHLLEREAIARHLLRPVEEVYFQHDAYEPLFSRFERRIYNLAAHREHLEIPFRYSSKSRQGDHGDTIALADMPEGQGREDIGMYFGTRRSDNTALTLIANELQQEALLPAPLPVHVITEGYMEDSLRMVKTIAEHLHATGEHQPHCFVIQRRHAADDRHLGAALLVMHPEHPDRPQRIIFCDTLNPSGTPPWWHSFKRKVDTVFPQPEGSAPASDLLEDGGVKLQRLHDGVPVRHQDIDCAFYTASIGRALIQVARYYPDLILEGTIGEIVSQMTARMPEYYAEANQPKDPIAVREMNVIRRWNTGRQALQNLARPAVTTLATQEIYLTEAA